MCANVWAQDLGLNGSCGDLIGDCNYRKFIHTRPFILAIGRAYTVTIFMRRGGLHVRVDKRDARNTHNLTLSDDHGLMFQQLNNRCDHTHTRAHTHTHTHLSP